MRICVILEGCYPYVTGGVSSWIHQYMQAMPQHEFIIYAIGASSDIKGKFKYQLPSNVVEVKEIFLADALKLAYSKEKYKFTQSETEALHDFINCASPNWDILFEMYSKKKVSPIAFLMSNDFMELLTKICENEYPYTAFSDTFHTVRSMLLPVLYIITQDVPKADIYHAIATGYSGIVARLGGYLHNAPFVITEHGIYTREREEEIIRAKWVQPAFKKFWVRFFYMLSDGAYSKATMISSLFAGAMKIQIEMGCDSNKCRFIGNGIHYENFKDINLKQENGYIDIGAVLRISPIKDVKTMIYAFAEVKKKVPNARMTIAGPSDDEQYAKECFALAKQLDVKDLSFPGTVKVTEFLKDIDFTVLSSISEGMPLAVLESFAAGRPCIATDVGSCSELVHGVGQDTYGDAGIIVPPMHVQALADAMIYMCLHRDDMKRMAQNGRDRVKTYFLHEDMVENYLDLYDEVFRRWRGSDLA